MTGPSKIMRAASAVTSAAVKEVMPAARALQNDFAKPFLETGPVKIEFASGAPSIFLRREADVASDKARRMPETTFIQRKCSHCDEEEKVQVKPLATTITPFIQTKASDGNTANNAVSSEIKVTKSSGNSMDKSTQAFMESRFNNNFSDVKIHTGGNAAKLNDQLNAHAFTVGNDIYFNTGKYAPESSSGKQLLAHELTHVIQQREIPKSIQRQEKDKDKIFAPKLDVDYKFLPPHLQFKLFHFLLAADTDKVHFDYTTKSFMTGLSYKYGDALSLNMKFNDFSTKLGWQPGANNLSLGFNYGKFSTNLAANPWQQKYGFTFNYGAPLLPFQDQMYKTFTAGGNAFSNMVTNLPGAIDDPINYYQQHKTDIENISSTVDLVKKITEAGKRKIRFGGNFSLTYDPINEVVITAKVGFLF